MGGQAFASCNPPLPTPRMPPKIFREVLARSHTVLRQCYTHVDSAIEAPGKETYGDVDTLVYGALDPSWDSMGNGSAVVAEHLAKILRAEKYMTQRGNPTINFAVPWPEQSEDGDEPRYVQLDVHTCPTLTSFNWELFHAAHGDLWNILGSTIRPFGLTVNDRGMHLRIPEIELYERKKSMIFLTAEPSQILLFLGLTEKRWWRQFNDREEMFQYATECRMFYVTEKDDENETVGDVVDEAEAGKPGIEGQEGGEKGKKKLKHNDRQRMAKRPIFKAWIDEFIPRCRERGIYGNPKLSREQIQQEASMEFGIQEEYQARLKQWKLAKNKDEIWRDAIKGCVPVEGVDPAFRAAAIRTLKPTIMDGLEFDGAVPQAAEKDQEGFYDVGEVKQFVLSNWEKAGRIGLARQQARSLEMMKAKLAERERSQKSGCDASEGKVPT